MTRFAELESRSWPGQLKTLQSWVLASSRHMLNATQDRLGRTFRNNISFDPVRFDLRVGI
jgi:hypothetical protein